MLAFFLAINSLTAQEQSSAARPPVGLPSSDLTELPTPACSDVPCAQQNPQPQRALTSGTSNNSAQAEPNTTQPPDPPDEDSVKPLPQPKRILGVMPNFRAVSADTLPPPPTPDESFLIATKSSFDYTSFLFTGATSALAEWTNAHPQLGQGMPSFGRYYWRGSLEKLDGNYFVIFVLPTVFHQDESYYSMGKGGFWKRAIYSASRVLINPNYHGHNSFNVSEVLGRAIAQGVSVSYYPSQARTPGSLASKYGFAIGRDVLTNVFR